MAKTISAITGQGTGLNFNQSSGDVPVVVEIALGVAFSFKKEALNDGEEAVDVLSLKGGSADVYISQGLFEGVDYKYQEYEESGVTYWRILFLTGPYEVMVK